MKNSKIKLILVLLIILPFGSFCQKSDTSLTKKMSIGLSFSPDYCYRVLLYQPGFEFAKDQRDSTEFPRFGFTTAANVALRIKKRITIEAGLQFSMVREILTFDTLKPFGYTPTDPLLVVKGNFTYNLYFINLPVKVNFNILTKRAKLYVFAGISPDILFTKKTTINKEYRNGQTSSNSSFSGKGSADINLTAFGGFGFSYDFSKRFYLQIEPVFRMAFYIFKTLPLRQFPYSAGLNTGIFYKL